MTTSAPIVQGNAAEDPLRFTFVEMLFALAVSQVAMSAADLASLSNTFLQKAPALSHLTLCLAVIATSWVGWRRSQSPGAKPPIASIFGIRFVELLLDVLLVIFYFILVKSIEIEQVAGNPRLTAPSAVPEALWISVIFAVYVAWDLIADVLSSGCIPAHPDKPWWRLWKGCRVAIVAVCSSLSCFGLAFLVFKRAQDISTTTSVVAFDAALLMAVLLFRVLKVFENPLSRLFRVADCKAFSSERVQQTFNDYVVCALLVALYAISLGIAECSASVGLVGHR